MLLIMSWYFYVNLYYAATILLVILNGCVYECGADHDRIIGGTAISIKKSPYIAAIILKYKHTDSVDFRGAAVIASKYWALTAAHCIAQFGVGVIEGGFLFLRTSTNTWDVEEGEKYFKDHKIIESHKHPDFGQIADYDCDIGIMKVEQAFNGRYEKPIKVAGKNFVNNMEFATVSGWGTTDYNVQVPVETLRAVDIVMYSHKKCKHFYKKLHGAMFTSKMLCGGADQGGRDACNGDSGGPLVYSHVLVGIVSFGVNCGLAKYPGLYTKVSAFHDWLENMEKDLNTTFGITFIDNLDDFVERKALSS